MYDTLFPILENKPGLLLRIYRHLQCGRVDSKKVLSKIHSSTDFHMRVLITETCTYGDFIFILIQIDARLSMYVFHLFNESKQFLATKL